MQVNLSAGAGRAYGEIKGAASEPDLVECGGGQARAGQ